VHIDLGENASMNVRLIDCVGYIVPSSLGYIENEQPRMVVTPWFDKEIPFNMAAEVGTRKVIADHSTIGLVVTTDGSISDIPRSEYEEAEERVISELKEINKPFAILLNCAYPHSDSAAQLQAQMTEKYQVPVVVSSCLDLGEQDIRKVLSSVLYQFQVKEVSVDIPGWIVALEKEHWLKSDIYTTIQDAARGIERIRDVAPAFVPLTASENISAYRIDDIDLGRGSVSLSITVASDLFYRIIGEATGIEIASEADLMPRIIELAQIKRQYDKISGALEEVAATGYGIVMPGLEELTLEEPQIVNQGGKYGVKLRASAPSIHSGGSKKKFKVCERGAERGIYDWDGVFADYVSLSGGRETAACYKCESRVEKSGKRWNKLIKLNHHEYNNMGNSTYQTVLHRLPSL